MLQLYCVSQPCLCADGISAARRERSNQNNIAGWSSLVARCVHNSEVVSSNLTPAPIFKYRCGEEQWKFAWLITRKSQVRVLSPLSYLYWSSYQTVFVRPHFLLPPYMITAKKFKDAVNGWIGTMPAWRNGSAIDL